MLPRHQVIRKLRTECLTNEERTAMKRALDQGCSYIAPESRLIEYRIFQLCKCRHRTAVPEGFIGVRLTEFGESVMENLDEGRI